MENIKKITPHEAYYLKPKDGGFQLWKLTIEDDVVLLDEPASAPDAWNQIMSELEHEVSKKFQ